MKLQEASLWRSILSISSWQRKKIRKDLFGMAEQVLFLPDLFGYFLSGERTAEYSIASTSQLLDARGKSWSEEILKAAGISRRLFSRYLHAWHTAWNAPKRAESGTWCEVIEGYYGGRSRYAECYGGNSGRRSGFSVFELWYMVIIWDGVKGAADQ